MAASRQSLISNAERLVSRGKLQAAIDQYRKLLAKSPDDTSTLNRVGDLYARLDQVDKAVDLFSKAADHFTRGGFFLKGIAIYKKIIRLDPARIESGANLADLQRRQGLITDARVQYQSVAKQYLQASDTDSAIRTYRDLIDLEPRNPSHRLHLAELYQETDQLPEAMAQFREIAGLMLAHGRIEEATQVCLKALEVAPKELSFLSGILQELRAGGHADEADRVMAIAIEKNPEASLEVEAVTAAAPVVEPEPEPLPEVEADSADGVDESVLEEALEEALAAEAAAGEKEVEEEIEFDIDLDGIEDLEVDEAPSQESLDLTAAEEAALEESVVAEQEKKAELLVEADVLARYGMEDKAVERLEEILEIAQEDPEVHCRLITLHLELNHPEQVAELANQLAGFESSQQAEEAWETVQKLLISDGFTIDGRQVSPPESAASQPEEEAEAEVQAEPAVAEDASWLEGLSQVVAEAEASGDELFEAEDEFFDLATELEKELDDDEELEGGELLVAPEEQSLEEIVEGFKKGMAETLSAEDYDTHYNLGIAYREMELVDEAIGEFQLAAKDPRYLVDCCSLLATCFLEKGFPELAVKWYKEGLESPTITEQETLGLWYELGDLYLSIGEEEQARLRFVEIYGINSGYRDIGRKLEDLSQG